jgi:hypothetical protein
MTKKELEGILSQIDEDANIEFVNEDSYISPTLEFENANVETTIASDGSKATSIKLNFKGVKND